VDTIRQNNVNLPYVPQHRTNNNDLD